MENKGLFITLEGGDGSGKSTVMKAVFPELSKLGYPIYQTREPGGTKISEEIRKIILDRDNTEEDIKTEALLYAASRRQNMVEKVFPLLNENKIVISDRYVDSSLVYQGYARGIGIDEVLNINMFAIDGRLPDMTVLFEIKPEIGLARLNKQRGENADRLDVEKLSFHQKVYEGYQLIAKRFAERFVVIDASKPLAEVETEVFDLLRFRIEKYLKGLK